MQSLRSPLLISLATKLWSACNQPIQMALISIFFSLELQGYYYAFYSLLALQMFIELGASTIIIHFTAFEWNALHFDPKKGIYGRDEALARLQQFARHFLNFFIFGILLLVVIYLIVGLKIFGQKEEGGIHWKAPWVILSLCGGLQVFTVPAMAFLEGAHQMKAVLWIRLIESLLLGCLTWICIAFGLKLWTCPIALGISLTWTWSAILLKYRAFFKTLLQKPKKKWLVWREEIWPLQWKMALSFFSGYFVVYFMNLIVFSFKGAALAGKFGMSMTLICSLANLGGLWCRLYTPTLGGLIADSNHPAIDKLFKHLLALTCATALLVTVAAWTLLHWSPLNFMLDRLLPSPSLEFFLAGGVSLAICSPFATYIRAHKQETLWRLSLLLALCVIASTYLCVTYFESEAFGVCYWALQSLSLAATIKHWYHFQHVHLQPQKPLQRGAAN